jgi:DNA-binding NtrC family response regulator
VDDTKNIRVLLTKCLEFEGYSVSTASDGREAMEIVLKKPFDLIFLDVRMPEKSGTEVLREIRENGISTPIIMITAFGTVKNAVDCTQLGAVAYLQKPFTQNKIKSILEEMIHSKPEKNSLKNILNLAEEQINDGRFKDAENSLKNSLSIYLMEPKLYLLLAQVYEKLNKNADSIKCLEISNILNK